MIRSNQKRREEANYNNDNLSSENAIHLSDGSNGGAVVMRAVSAGRVQRMVMVGRTGGNKMKDDAVIKNDKEATAEEGYGIIIIGVLFPAEPQQSAATTATSKSKSNYTNKSAEPSACGVW